MFVPPVVLVFALLALFLLALGQDPTKKHGPFAVACLAIALLAYFASDEAPRLLAAFTGR